MADEIQVSVSLTFTKTPLTAQSLAVALSTIDVAGKNFTHFTQVIPTTAGGTAIKLSGLSNVGWVLLVNRDLTNFVDVLTAVSGTAFARILPGEPALFRITPALTAPALLADTLSCMVEGLLVEI